MISIVKPFGMIFGSASMAVTDSFVSLNPMPNLFMEKYFHARPEDSSARYWGGDEKLITVT
jgi:hypothetical protein